MENSPYFVSCSCRSSCLVKALAAINTLAGISQPPPNTPYPFLGSGCIKYSNTSSSSFSTQYMQFTGHDSTETYKNETKMTLFGVLLSFISTDLLSFTWIFLSLSPYWTFTRARPRVSSMVNVLLALCTHSLHPVRNYAGDLSCSYEVVVCNY